MTIATILTFTKRGDLSLSSVAVTTHFWKSLAFVTNHSCPKCCYCAFSVTPSRQSRRQSCVQPENNSLSVPLNLHCIRYRWMPWLSHLESSSHSFFPPRYQWSFSIVASTNRYFTSNIDGDNGESDWIPPEHSPLTKLKTRTHHKIKNFTPINENSNVISNETNKETELSVPLNGEIEIIDLESTFKNPINQEILEGMSSSRTEENDLFNEGFEVETSQASLSEVLKELKESGQHNTVKDLVNEYGLQGTLDDMEKTENRKEVDNDDEEEEDYEKYLENLSQEDLIDELIENSPPLYQLEMEIISRELDRSPDIDKVDDLDLSDSIDYNEFRKMVLDDYHERKNTMKTMEEIRPKEYSINDLVDSMFNNEPRYYPKTSSSDHSSFPPDWKDYDSKSAFQRDFLGGDDSWVPLASDSASNSKLSENHIDSVPTDETIQTNNFDNTIDWLEARRSRLAGVFDSISVTDSRLKDETPSHLLTPEKAKGYVHQSSQIPILPYTLFTTSELSTSLVAQGGKDIHVIDTSNYDSLYGADIGCDNLMIVTGRSPSHIRVLADSVVRNLKARKLNERGVVGATEGAEGGKDIFSNKKTRNRASRKGQVTTSSLIDDDWMVVDCGNIHVHILEETTRKCLNIESLWDLSNPNSEGTKLRKVDYSNEDEVDTYVAENPVPHEYSAQPLYGGKTKDWISGGVGERVYTFPPTLNKKSFSSKWSGSKGKVKNRRYK